MKIPKEDYSEPPLITPERSVRLRAKAYGLKMEDLKVPKCVVLSLTVVATELLVKHANAEPVPWIYRARPFYVGNVEGISVGVIWGAPSAPLATFVMEDLVACGARVFIGVGLLGAIQPDIQIGDFIIPVEAVRDEGTSLHYLPKDVRAVPSEKVVNALKDACKKFVAKYRIGPVWTTDTPYRETESKIKHFQTQGVLGVDMETSAVLSLAIYRNVKAGCMLVTSDNLATLTSVPGLETRELKQATEKAVKIVMEAVKVLAWKNESLL